MAQTINGVNVPASAMMTRFGEVKMSSREIAVLTEKQHRNVVRDIQVMLEQLGEDPGGYAHFWTHPQNGREYREFLLDREHTECLIAGYSAPLRMKIIRRLRELENRGCPPIPHTLPDALRLAADLAERNNALENKARQDAPKVAYFNDYIDAKDTKSLRETAKVLNMSERALIAAMVRDRILFRQAGILLPLAIRQADGYFTVKTGKSDGGRAFTQTRVTPKGIAWLSRRYASELVG